MTQRWSIRWNFILQFTEDFSNVLASIRTNFQSLIFSFSPFSGLKSVMSICFTRRLRMKLQKKEQGRILCLYKLDFVIGASSHLIKLCRIQKRRVNQIKHVIQGSSVEDFIKVSVQRQIFEQGTIAKFRDWIISSTVYYQAIYQRDTSLPCSKSSYSSSLSQVFCHLEYLAHLSLVFFTSFHWYFLGIFLLNFKKIIHYEITKLLLASF